MCLAIPSRIIEMEDMRAVVDVCGARREVNLMLLPEDVVIGDYVLVHAGFAMRKVDQEAAEEALKFIRVLIEEHKDDAPFDYSNAPDSLALGPP